MTRKKAPLKDIKAHTEAEFISNVVTQLNNTFDQYNEEIKYKFLLGFTSHMILSALSRAPEEPCSKEEFYEFVKNNFSIEKSNIENIIAESFTGAMIAFSGRDVEYTCKIKALEDRNTSGTVH